MIIWGNVHAQAFLINFQKELNISTGYICGTVCAISFTSTYLYFAVYNAHFFLVQIFEGKIRVHIIHGYNPVYNAHETMSTHYTWQNMVVFIVPLIRYNFSIIPYSCQVLCFQRNKPILNRRYNKISLLNVPQYVRQE